MKWLIYFGDHMVGRATTVQGAIEYAVRIVDPRGRNVRIITPSGMRLDLLAASLLL